MEATLKYIEKKFREYNKEYFNNELPPLIFELMKSYKLCGQFSYRKMDNKGRMKSPKIEISCYYDWNEEDLKNVLVHEMIHYYLAYKHIDEKLTHGDDFKKTAEQFNKKYNLNITEKIDCNKFKKAKNAPLISWFLINIFC